MLIHWINSLELCLLDSYNWSIIVTVFQMTWLDVRYKRMRLLVSLVELDSIWIRIIYVRLILMEPLPIVRYIITVLILVTNVRIISWNKEVLSHFYVPLLIQLINVLLITELFLLLLVPHARLDSMLVVMLVLLERMDP
jgi:hypothetical protein